MENNRLKQTLKPRALRSNDNKRIISSELSHYPRQHHQRKFTIDNDPRKSLRQPLVPRKNQSLPRHLANTSQPILQYNIRSRKIITSISKSNKQSKLSTLTVPGIGNNQREVRMQIDKQPSFIRGIQLFKIQNYKKAIAEFESLYKQFQGANRLEKLFHFMGWCYWHIGHTEKGVIYLSKALQNDYEFSSEGYDRLSTFYESTKNYNCELNTLDKWVRAETSSKAHLMRARVHFLQKDYDKAIKDYVECYQIEPTKLEAYIEQAEAIYKMDGLQPSLDKYNSLLLNYNKIWPQSKHSDINYVKYKKSLLLLQQKHYQQALTLLKQVKNRQLLSEVGYYIGVTYQILGHQEEALLAFRQAIQANSSAKFVGQSYYQKLVILFKKNQFYAVQYELDRISGQFPENEMLKLLKTVVEGMIYVLKMNFRDALKVFQSLRTCPLFLKCSKLYSNIVASFTIFTYYSLHELECAFTEFSSIKCKKMLDSNTYNYTMLRAIRAGVNHDYNQALKLFQEAENIEPFNNHTFMVKAIVEIMLYNKLQKEQSKQDNNQQILLSAEELLNRCLLKQPQNDQLLYLLAAINYQIGQYESGLKLIRKAIQSSDDHTIKHYYLKANLKIMLQMYEQSINDYSSAILVINEQEKIIDNDNNNQTTTKQNIIRECYLQRAKCYILTGNLQKAQTDLRTFFSELDDVRKYVDQLDLFMHIGCSDVIVDIYKSILDEHHDPYNRMKCYYLAKQLNNCLSIMNSMLQYEQEEYSDQELQTKYNLTKLAFDRDCLEALKKSSQGSTIFVQQAINLFENKLLAHVDGDIFKRADCLFFAGVMCYHLEEFQKAKNYFIDAKSEKLDLGQISKNDEQDQGSVQNRLFNLEEINYNIGLCDFIQNKWSTYLEEYPEFKKFHHSPTKELKSLEETDEITPFSVKNRLCSIYNASQMGPISFRLSFCLPKVVLKEIKFTKNHQIIQSLTLRDIDMRPSAPWIQKSKKGIVFTSDGLKDSIDLKSEKSKKTNTKKKGQQRYKLELQ